MENASAIHAGIETPDCSRPIVALGNRRGTRAALLARRVPTATSRSVIRTRRVSVHATTTRTAATASAARTHTRPRWRTGSARRSRSSHAAARPPRRARSQLGDLEAATTDVTLSIGGNDAGFGDVIFHARSPGRRRAGATSTTHRRSSATSSRAGSTTYTPRSAHARRTPRSRSSATRRSSTARNATPARGSATANRTS